MYTYECNTIRVIDGNTVDAVIDLGFNVTIRQRIKLYGINVEDIRSVDNDKKKVNSLKKGIPYIKNKNLRDFKYFKHKKNQVSSDYKILKNCDAILICLPTPLKNLKPDMSYVFKCASKIRKIIKPFQILILESTVYPGATYEVLKMVKNKKLQIGKNFFVGYSPERENPGDEKFSYKKTPKVISGATKTCELLIKKIYSPIVKKLVIAKNIHDAELSKLLENMYRAVNIGLVNELKIICDKLKIDIFIRNNILFKKKRLQVFLYNIHSLGMHDVAF